MRYPNFCKLFFQTIGNALEVKSNIQSSVGAKDLYNPGSAPSKVPNDPSNPGSAPTKVPIEFTKPIQRKAAASIELIPAHQHQPGLLCTACVQVQ